MATESINQLISNKHVCRTGFGKLCCLCKFIQTGKWLPNTKYLLDLQVYLFLHISKYKILDFVYDLIKSLFRNISFSWKSVQSI